MSKREEKATQDHYCPRGSLHVGTLIFLLHFLEYADKWETRGIEGGEEKDERKRREDERRDEKGKRRVKGADVGGEGL